MNENRVLRRLFGLKTDEVMRGWRVGEGPSLFVLFAKYN
jgi:hypothetical protein